MSTSLNLHIQQSQQTAQQLQQSDQHLERQVGQLAKELSEFKAQSSSKQNMNPRENPCAITLRSGIDLQSPSTPSSLFPNEEEESIKDKTNSGKAKTPQPKVISKSLNSSSTDLLPFPLGHYQALNHERPKDPKGKLSLKEHVEKLW
ncbi:hypothetical protein ACH5RR_012764 [Cinchona calisaya]|uniref:Uncharacterized protein n=1 Tax=Cinchona calisaya TaxID=153742 RepID=A0ABD3AEH1_9GENT